MNRRFAPAVVLLAASLNACVSGPYDGDMVGAKKTEAIAMAGLAPRSDAKLTIEFFDPEIDDWRRIKDARPNGETTTLSNGEVWHQWNTNVVVPRWTDGCGYHSTQLRTRFDGGSVFLPVF